MSKCDINFSEITCPPLSCLLGNFSIIVRSCSWYSFVVMIIFILCNGLFQKINLRSSLPGCVLEKKCSFYIWGSPRKTKGNLLTELNIFSANILKFCQLCVLSSFIHQRFSPWYEVKWMEKFLKFRPLAYLKPCETSMI